MRFQHDTNRGFLDTNGTRIYICVLDNVKTACPSFYLNINVVHVAEIAIRDCRAWVQTLAIKNQINLAVWSELLGRPERIDDPRYGRRLRDKLGSCDDGKKCDTHTGFTISLKSS